MRLPFTADRIPPLDSFSELLPTLRSKKIELDVEIAKRKAECATIRAQMNKGALDPGNAAQVRARQLLGEDMDVMPASMERLSQVQRELEDFCTARGIVEGKIQSEERIAGNKQREAVQPELDRLGRNFANAFLAVHTAHLEYQSLVNRLEDAGGNISTLHLSPAGLVRPTDPNSPYALGLQEFADAGYFSKSELKKVFG